MKKYLILVAGLISIEVGFSQDLHFSQYNENPSLVNPALTGASSVLRAMAIYKSQWSSVTVPYTTFGASFEMKFKASNWEKQDPFRARSYKKAFSRMAGGLSFFSDKAGDGNMGTNVVNLSLATFIKAAEYQTFSLGLQGSVIQKTINFDKFIFSNQYTATGYDPNVPNNEHFGSTSFIWPDMAAGLLWNYSREESSISENNQLKADVGVSVYHIINPKEKYLIGSNELLSGKLVVHSKWLIGVPHSNLGLAPSFIFSFQGPQKELMLGLMAKYYLKDDSHYTGYIRKSSIGIGAYYRYQDALAVAALIELGQYAVGFTYDLNISSLTKASSLRGGPEITLRFNSANPFLFQKR